MKLIVDAKPFAAALAIAGRVIETKTPRPILSNVYLRAEGSIGGELTIRGTNNDVTYEARIIANVETEGEALVSFATLAKFISAARGDEVAIAVDAESAAVKCGRGKIALAAANASDFPMYMRTPGDLVAVDPKTFLHALRFCSAAVRPSEVAYHIAGVSISEIDGGVDFWGTDGKIAHRARLPHLPGIGGGGQIPIEAVGIILGVAEKATEARVIVTETGWAVETNGVSAWGKVIDAKFPDMDRALARFKDWREIAVADPAHVSQALDIAVCGADSNSDKTRHVVLRTDGAMVLRGFRPGGGVITAGRAEADADVRGEAAMAISADYLKTTLTSLATDGVTISAESEAIKIAPRQMDAAIMTEGVIFIVRASDAEMADV